jgi:multicomponent Na+:H+ antiporter subunit D
MQLLLFAGFAFFALLTLMKRTLTISLDFDWFYRKLMFGVVVWIKEHSPKFFGPALLSLKGFGQRYFDRMLKVHGPQGILARTWPSASMVLWVAVLLATAMILHFIKN